MCGIVGYIGSSEAAPILVEGLRSLEYRGYDSAGVAIYSDNSVGVRKCKGRLQNLEDSLKNKNLVGSLGIGHTRWATHGAPSDCNSHPHYNKQKTIAVVHNGIIENYMSIKESLTKKGYVFESETDTEVIAHLIDSFYKNDLKEAVKNAVLHLEGSYALGVISSLEPDKMIATRKDSPLIAGIGEKENFIASDIPAILKHTKKVYLLEDREIVTITKSDITIENLEGNLVEREVFNVTWNVEAAEKGGYEHFMIKEIHEEPKGIKDTLTGRLTDKGIKLDKADIPKEIIEKIKKVYIVACGTAYHAGIVGSHCIEKFAKIPCETDIASEFRYRDPMIDETSLLIVISQSGETADTLAALRLAKKKGAKVLAVTNVVGSTVSREADYVLYTWAGPEIAVASTKAYTTQLIALYLVSLDFALKLNQMDEKRYNEIKKGIEKTIDYAKTLIENKTELQKLADNIHHMNDVYFLGRGLDFSVAQEGALKLKEISYIHADAYPAGELKHGPIALIEDGTVVVCLATQDNLFEKMLSNMKEVKARGGYIIGIAKKSNKALQEVADLSIYIEDCIDELAPVSTVIPLQMLAYYVAVARGCDVDKPRNLAKSVTVE